MFDKPKHEPVQLNDWLGALEVQMRAVGDLPPVPSRAAVDARSDLWNASLRLSTAIKKKAGAPKKMRGAWVL